MLPLLIKQQIEAKLSSNDIYMILAVYLLQNNIQNVAQMISRNRNLSRGYCWPQLGIYDVTFDYSSTQ